MATARGVHASKVPLLPPELGGGQAAPCLESRGKNDEDAAAQQEGDFDNTIRLCLRGNAARLDYAPQQLLEIARAPEPPLQGMAGYAQRQPPRCQ